MSVYGFFVSISFPLLMDKVMFMLIDGWMSLVFTTLCPASIWSSCYMIDYTLWLDFLSAFGQIELDSKIDSVYFQLSNHFWAKHESHNSAGRKTTHFAGKTFWLNCPGNTVKITSIICQHTFEGAEHRRSPQRRRILRQVLFFANLSWLLALKFTATNNTAKYW